MDNASAYGAEDSRFESWQVHNFYSMMISYGEFSCGVSTYILEDYCLILMAMICQPDNDISGMIGFCAGDFMPDFLFFYIF